MHNRRRVADLEILSHKNISMFSFYNYFLHLKKNLIFFTKSYAFLVKWIILHKLKKMDIV